MRGNHNQNIFKIYFELKSQIKETKLNRFKFGSLKRLLSSVNEVGEAGGRQCTGLYYIISVMQERRQTIRFYLHKIKISGYM